MKSFRTAALAAAIAFAAIAPSAEAGPLRNLLGRSSCGKGGCNAEATPAASSIELPPGIMSVDSTSSVSSAESEAQRIAQSKAETQARLGVMHHPGGSFGGGTAEGVGFSTSGPEDAIRRCCFWGKRQPIGIGVARGIRGWFAAVLYR